MIPRRLSPTSFVAPIAALLILLVAQLSLAAQATTLQGKVMQVKDGDTVVISPADGGAYFTCRIYGIDAPETPKTSKKGKVTKPGQPYGLEAMMALKEMTLGSNVEVIKTGAKTYNRDVCLIIKNGTSIGHEMVKRGYAWAYRQYMRRPHASEYIEAENNARAKRLGLWQDVNPTPPWEFRKKQRRK